ncbi:hypothetical protein N181_12275 [Sinorhizobium fredii USDA 205]|nr:hypothetical protein N181_12275 [Sinorhizobium fredii USDA 205]
MAVDLYLVMITVFVDKNLLIHTEKAFLEKKRPPDSRAVELARRRIGPGQYD